MTQIKNKNFKKLLSLVITFVILTVSSTLMASASWYGWSKATFSSRLYGQERYYDGNNVGLNWGASTHNSRPYDVSNSNGFRITLQRKGWFGIWTDVGYRDRLDRNSGGSATWTNVGSGTYRFVFSKSIDGTTEYVEGIEMYSW